MGGSRPVQASCELVLSLEEIHPSRWYKDFWLGRLGKEMSLNCFAEGATDSVFAWEQRTFQGTWGVHNLYRCHKSSNQEGGVEVQPRSIFGEPFFGTWTWVDGASPRRLSGTS